MTAQANQRSLADLRADLRVRLGFGAQGASGGTLSPILDSFLRSAQSLLYWNYDWPEIRFEADKSLGQNQTLVDYPDGMEPRRIVWVRALVSNFWTCDLQEGIESWMDADPSHYVGYPQRIDRFEQLKVWPSPDQPYTLRFSGYRVLGPLQADDDFTTIDGNLVFLQALADAKDHYRQPDATRYQNQVSALLKPLRGAAHMGRRYIPGPERRDYAPPMPVIKT